MAEQQELPAAPEPGLGACLKTRRESLGLSLETVAERTRIRRSYLYAFETECFEDLPALPYAIGFLRIYAGLLELDSAQVVAEFRQLATSGSVSPGRAGSLPATFPDRIPGGSKTRRWFVLILVLAVALLAWRLGLFERFRENVPTEESPSGVTGEAASGGGSVPGPHEVETRAASPLGAGDMPVAENAPPVVENVGAASDITPPALPGAEERTPVPANGPGKAGTMTVPLPPGGAVFRVKSGGTGRLRIVVDDLEERRYAMYPEMAMSWSIRRFARVRINIAGGLQAWLGDRPLALDGDAEVIFGLMDETP